MNDKEPTLFSGIAAPMKPFDGARVYLSGTFSVHQSVIINKLIDAGAIGQKIGPKGGFLPQNLAKTTCVIIAGKKQSESDLLKIETLAHDGYHIPSITEEEMELIISGKKQASFPQPIKNVDITFDFLFNSKVPKIIHFNFYEYTHCLGTKELFMHDIKGEKELLLQCLGNIGAYSNFEFDPKTIDYCWLKKETIEKLKKGEKDEFIQIIPNKYNTSNSDKFTYKFIIESEAIFWMEYRAKEIGDEISLDYITRYQRSVYKLKREFPNNQ